MTTRDGEETKGFPASIVPTIEEQTITEHRPQKGGDHDKPIMDELEDGRVEASKEEKEEENGGSTKPNMSIAPSEARVHDGSGQLFGSPANAKSSPQTDDQPPYSASIARDADKEEEAAIPARKLLREHLNVKVGTKPWTLPTPTPKVDPHGFDDPVADSFYKDIWMASAAHNVGLPRPLRISASA